MPQLLACPQCGGSIPPAAPAGLCPTCLLGLGLASTPRPAATPNDPLTRPTVVPDAPLPAGLSFAPTHAPRSVAVDWATPSGSAVVLDLAVPAVLGNYDLGEELGRGGMGMVFRAVQRVADRVVAVKVLHGGLAADRTLRDRFAAEVQALARLNHPNIVPVYEVGQDRGSVYYSMEYAPGGSLAVQLRTSLPPPAEAAALIGRLARAVHSAHELGVLHRDIKPANVLLAADGRPMLSDFGLAKRLDRDDGPTVIGQVMGTPNYMAPEQAAGSGAAAVGPRADVYGLGATLYEVLTGRPPFAGATPSETVRRLTAHDPVPPRRLRPEVPADLEAVCLKCLEKDPDKRYPTANELADDLGRVARGEPTAARPPSWPRRVWKRTRRRPAVAAAVVLLVTGGVVLPAVIPFGQRSPQEQLDRAARRGEKITLVGPVGHPIYHRWAAGVGQLGDPHTGGPFAVRSEGPGMIELLPDTHTERYRFSAEFQVDEPTDSLTWAGIYLAHRPGKPGPAGTADRTVLVCFRDDLTTNRPTHPDRGDPLNAFDAIIGHGIRDPVDWWPIGDSWVREPKPSPRPWRRIVAEVDPDWVRVSFWRNCEGSDAPIDLRPISADSLRRRTAKHHARLREQWPDIDPGDLTYSPRGRLGVYVHNAKVFFRNVEFTPTSNP